MFDLRSGRAARLPFCFLRGRSSGFTLVELLVVVAIIGILAGIILVVAGPVRENARQTSCMSNLHQIALAVKLYIEDQQAYPPPVNPVTGMDGIYSLVAYNYIKDLKALRCPNDRATVDEYNAALQAAVPSATPWSQAWFDQHYSSYNVAVDRNSPPVQLAILYNYFGIKSNAVSTQGLTWADSLATAGQIYSGVYDRLGRSLWSGYINASNPGSPTASFPGLINRQAPDSTVVTRCIQHRVRGLDLVVTLGGRTEKYRAEYDWVRQP